MALTLRRYAWRPPLNRLSEWYDAGFRALWRHLRTTFGLESRAKRKLESAAARLCLRLPARAGTNMLHFGWGLMGILRTPSNKPELIPIATATTTRAITLGLSFTQIPPTKL
jgi:hypothetical protein